MIGTITKVKQETQTTKVFWGKQIRLLLKQVYGNLISHMII